MKRGKSKTTKRGLKGKTSAAMLFILCLVVIFSGFLVSSSKFSPTTQEVMVMPSYTCCDSGDGEACRPIEDKKIFYKGIRSSQEEEYQLLKSNVYLRSQDHHIDPDPNGATTPTGEKIFYNPRSERNELDWLPECFSNINSQGKQKYGYDDFIFGPGSPNLNPDNDDYPDLGCYAIPNEQLIYVCRSENAAGECESLSGTARFDVYYRASDFAATGVAGIHDIIKNCVKPEVTPSGGNGQQIISAPYPSGKPNLQLETFQFTAEPPVIDWISPYCKPAVYLYPEEKTTIRVQVLSDYKLTFTIPTYPKGGWNVQADPDGKIMTGGREYDYLYYETEVPNADIKLPDEGYVISSTELPLFIPKLVTDLGLNQKEARQFSEYWNGVLPEAAFYKIKIVKQEHLEKLASLKIIPQPTTTIRVTLHFEPLDKSEQIVEPNLSQVKRAGFTVVEWGGIFKRDKDRAFSCFM